MTTTTTAQHRSAGALATGQIADDMILIHHAAVTYGYDDMAQDYLNRYDDAIAYLHTDATLDAQIAGIKLTLAGPAAGRCPSHGYYPQGRCGIC